jgi:aryl sulfotransferase
VRSWWAVRDLPNVMLLHFNELKADMPGTIRRIAAFLDIPIAEDKWETILKHCSFEYMKEHGTRAVPLGGAFWEGGSSTFIYKGTNGRWRDRLSEDEIRRYEERARLELGEACAHWVATGELL